MEQLGIGRSVLGQSRPDTSGSKNAARSRDNQRFPANAENVATSIQEAPGQDAEARRFAADRHRFQEGQTRAHREPRARPATHHDSRRRRHRYSSPTRGVVLQALTDRVRSRNPYQLDSSGALVLPGFAPIMLAGLNEEQATHRLAAIDAFFKLDIKLTKLPIRKSGAAASSLSATTSSRMPRRPSRPSATCPCHPTTSSAPATSWSCNCPGARRPRRAADPGCGRRWSRWPR